MVFCYVRYQTYDSVLLRFKTFFYRLRIKDFTDLHQLVYITQTYRHVSQRIVQYMYLKFSFALFTYQIKVIPCYKIIFKKCDPVYK